MKGTLGKIKLTLLMALTVAGLMMVLPQFVMAAQAAGGTVSFTEGVLTINANWKRDIGTEEIVINDNNGIASADYDGNAHTPVITVTDTGRGTDPDYYTLSEVESGSGDYTVSYEKDGVPVEAPVEAGEYTVILTGAGEDYTGSRRIPFIIRAKLDNLKVSLTGWTNGMTPNTPHVTGSTGKGAVTCTYYTDAECETKTTQAGDGAGEAGAVPGRPGTYYVKATVEATKYYQKGEATAEFTIAKAKIPGFAVTMGSWLYGESHPAPVCFVPSTQYDTSDVFYEIKKKGDPDTSYQKFRTTSTAGGESLDQVLSLTWVYIYLEAGEYVLRATIPENGRNPDYAATTALTTFTVGKSKALVEVKGPYLEKDYDGTASALTGSGTGESTDKYTYTVSMVNNHPKNRWNQFNLKKLSVSESDPPAAVSRTDPGTSYMGLTAENFISAEPNYDVTFVVARDGYVSIHKAEIDTDDAESANYYTKLMTVSGLDQGGSPAASYTGEPVAVSVTDSDPGIGAVTVNYEKTKDANGDDVSEGATTQPPVNPGTYRVTLDIAEGKDYRAKSGIAVGTLTIAKGVYPGIKAVSYYVKTDDVMTEGGYSGSAALPNPPEGASFQTPTTQATWLQGCEVSGVDLYYQVAPQTEAGSQATVTIPVTGASLYQDYDVTVTIAVKAGTETYVTIKELNTGAHCTEKKVTYGDDAPAFRCEAANEGPNGSFTWTSSNPAVAEVDADGNVSIKGVGKTLITADYTSDEYFGSNSVLLTVDRKVLTLTGVSAEDKEYDGTTAMKVSGTPVLSGLAAGDEDKVSIASGTATASDANVGEEKTVGFAGYALSGEAAGNYTLSAQPEDVTAAITPRKLQVSGITATEREYERNNKNVGLNFDGSALSGLLAADADAVSLVTEQAAGIMADDLPGVGKSVSITGLALAGTAEGNYRIDPDCQKTTVTIGKRSAIPEPELTTEAESLLGKADGRIKGVTTAMEYRRDYGSAGYGPWTPCPAGDLYPLAAGNYEVRFSETDTDYASNARTITIYEGSSLGMVVSFRFLDETTIQDTIPVELSVAANDGTIVTEVKGGQGYSAEIGGLHYGTCFVEASYTYKLQDDGDPITATGSAQVEMHAQMVQCEIILPKPGGNEAKVETGSLADAGLSTVQVDGNALVKEAQELKDGNGQPITDAVLRMEITSGGTEATVTSGTDEEKQAKSSILTAAQTAYGDTASGGSSGSTRASFFEVDLKVIQKANGSETPITETGRVIELVLPYDFTGRFDVLTWRYHDGSAQAFNRLSQRPAGTAQDPLKDRTWFPDVEHGRIYIYTSKFCTYAVTYMSKSQYRIYLMKNDGTYDQIHQIAAEGEKVKLDNPFSKIRWNFQNWNSEEDGSGSVYANGQEVTIRKDMVLYAQWAENKSEITTYPVAIENLKYDGTEQELIRAGTATGGEMQYAIGMSDKSVPTTGWGKSIPKAADVRTYYVWYMVKGDENHFDTASDCIEVIIEKADMTVGVEGYDDIYDGTAHGITVNVTKPADNYTISYGTKEGTYDLTTAPTYTYASDEIHTVYFKVTAYGYNDHTGSALVKISKRPVTITADDKSTPYKAETEPLTYTVSGNIIAGDDLSIQLKTEASASKPVGEYPITVSYDTTKTDYAVTTVQGKYTINGAKFTYTASGYNGTYDGAAHSITVETSGDETVKVYYSTETELTDENYQTAGSTDNPTRTDAGTTTVYYYVSSQNYVPTSVYGNKDIVITKAEVGTPEVSMNDYTYGGDAPAPSIGYFPGGGTVTYYYNTVNSTEGGTQWKDVTSTTLNAGDYFMYAVIAESDNYNAYTTATTSFTVDKADQSPNRIIPPVGNIKLVYNGAAQELVEAGSASEGTMLYAVVTDGTTPEAEAYKEDIPKGIEPGTYNVWYMVKGDGNHNDTDPKSVKAVINKIEVMSIGLRAVNGTTMVPGASQQLEVTIVPSNAPVRHLTFTSTDPEVVTVDTEGLVTAGNKEGTAEIIAESYNRVKTSIMITVAEPIANVTGISIDPKSVNNDPKPGDTFRLTAVIEPANATDKTVTWKSDKPEVAEVGPTGIVTIRGIGTAVITVTSAANNEASAETTLVVTEEPVTGITIDSEGGNYLVVGVPVRLKATVTPANATNKGVTWSIPDAYKEIAEISEDGVVKGLRPGKVKIRAVSAAGAEFNDELELIVFEDYGSLYVEFIRRVDYAYTGSSITPMVNVYYKGELLTRDTDYTVSYENNKDANDASNVKKAPTVKVTGKTVAATAEAVFKILPADIGDEDLVTAQEVTVASGKKAAPELYFGGTKLAGKDFTNPYAKDKFYNSRPITVYGKGNFTGEREIWINVKSAQEVKNQPKIKVKSFAPVKRYYNGQPQTLSDNEIEIIDAKDKTKKLKMGEDFYIAYPEDVTSVGTVKIAVVGMGDYTGVVKKSYKIEAAKDDDVAEKGMDVSFLYSEGEYEVDGVKYDTFTYIPGGVQPYVKVVVELKSGEVETLISGRDYKVTYKDNKKAAKANKDKLSTATITFKGNYKSLKKTEKKFYIKQAELGAASVYAGNKVVTKGDAKYPISEPVVDIDGVTVKKSEYTVTYRDEEGDIINKQSKLNLEKVGDSAKVKVEITAKQDKSGAETGNYTGTNKEGSYVITLEDASKDLSKAKVIIQKTGDPNHKAVRKFDFTGNPIVIGEEPNEGYELYVFLGKNANDPQRVVLEEGTDYTVEYSNNVKAGKATIILNAKENSGKCFGSRTHNFNIVKGIMRWVK